MQELGTNDSADIKLQMHVRTPYAHLCNAGAWHWQFGRHQTATTSTFWRSTHTCVMMQELGTDDSADIKLQLRSKGKEHGPFSLFLGSDTDEQTGASSWAKAWVHIGGPLPGFHNLTHNIRAQVKGYEERFQKAGLLGLGTDPDGWIPKIDQEIREALAGNSDLLVFYGGVYLFPRMFDLVEQVIWLIHTCDMAYSCLWYDSFIRVTWLIRVCDVTHSYVWHDLFVCVIRLIHTCDMTYSCVCYDLFIRVTWLIRVCDMTHSYVWHDSFVCIIRQRHTCDLAHCMCDVVEQDLLFALASQT